MELKIWILIFPTNTTGCIITKYLACDIHHYYTVQALCKFPQTENLWEIFLYNNHENRPRSSSILLNYANSVLFSLQNTCVRNEKNYLYTLNQHIFSFCSINASCVIYTEFIHRKYYITSSSALSGLMLTGTEALPPKFSYVRDSSLSIFLRI